MLPKTYDRWSDEAKEERMRQNRILWDPSIIANQGTRSVPRIRQAVSTTPQRSRSETRIHQLNHELTSTARSRSETRVSQDTARPSQWDQLPQRSSSETRRNPRIEAIVKADKGTRSRSEDRAPLAKTLKEVQASLSKTQIDTDNLDGCRTNIRKGREEERRMSLPKVRKV